ncbi:zinc-ribbon domain-containing protein [uncultured Chloroflexus sp.]|uniref:zinc-ribbon domain-containing protein n=1 Tax=uncultured Chloroflexus sp. TaxID=214040 RepID=UPI00261A72E5|nr:zinc-ribbon domain-containing protein [uncultured Chloroflexus sp.]
MSEPQRPAFCPQCGHKLTPEDRFCPECGARVPDSTPPAAAPPTTIIPPDRPTAAPPTTIIPPVQSTNVPPNPSLPPPPAYGTPVSSSPPFHIPSAPELPANRSNNRLAWLLVGGIGCLSLIIISACIFIVIAFVATPTLDSLPTPTTAATTTAGSGVESAIGGEVVFRDDFDNPTASGLGEDEDASARFAFEQGHYVIEVKEAETLVWALVDGTYRDAVIEASYAMPRNGPDGAAGLIFRYQDADNFYLFSVSNDGYYALELLENDRWITLIDWTQHEAIHPENNRMRVELRGDEITLFVNDRRLEQTRDPTFTRGEVGLAVTSFDKGGIIVRYDEITIWRR